MARSQRAATTWTWTPPPGSRCCTAVQAWRSGAIPAQANFSNSSTVRSICLSVGWSSGAQAITPDVYLCLNSRESATSATCWGSPRNT